MKTLRRSPWLLALASVVVLGAAAVGYAATQEGPAIVTTIPQNEDQMTNIDVLRQQIKNYYGVPLATTGSSPTGGWTLPLNPDSNYATEARKVAADGEHWLAAKANASSTSAKKAIIVDVDDTALATFNYELYSNWDFNGMTNDQFATDGRFPAVPGMVELATQAKAEGYKLVFLTGRRAALEVATLANLIKPEVGYPAPSALPDATLGGGSDGIFTKPAIADYPPYLLAACAAELALTPPKSCTTIHYKSATRAYLESLGYDIVGNFGDQFSDLIGGFADRTFKLPNPNYFLP
jgi:predicted secreted acid phosphatase